MTDVELKPLDAEHLEWARLLHNDPDVLAMLTDPTIVSPEQQARWFDSLQNSKTSQRLMAVIDGVVVGLVRIDSIDYNNKSVCVGLDIHKDHRGKGYAKPIYNSVLRDWFDNKDFNRVWLMVVEYNKVARKLYKSLGFLEENIQRQALFKNGKYYDYYGMSILKDSWVAITSPKRCNKCLEVKEPSDFFRLYRRSCVRLQSICKECQVKSHKDYCERTKENRRIWKRRSDLKKKYGISIEQYQEMLVKQEFACAVCKEPEKYSTSANCDPILAVDHCHSTNKVRGLLCSQCNQGIGKFKDSIELLEAAISYLKDNEDE